MFSMKSSSMATSCKYASTVLGERLFSSSRYCLNWAIKEDMKGVKEVNGVKEVKEVKEEQEVQGVKRVKWVRK